jgi:hypothetical protein
LVSEEHECGATGEKGWREFIHGLVYTVDDAMSAWHRYQEINFHSCV